jgi:hypothetical protein
MPGDGGGPLHVLSEIRDVLVEILGALRQKPQDAEGEHAHHIESEKRPAEAGFLDEFRKSLAQSARKGLEAAPANRGAAIQDSNGQGAGARQWNATSNLLGASGMGDLSGLMNGIKGFADAVREFRAAFSTGSGKERPQAPTTGGMFAPSKPPAISVENPFAARQAQEHRGRRPRCRPWPRASASGHPSRPPRRTSSNRPTSTSSPAAARPPRRWCPRAGRRRRRIYCRPPSRPRCGPAAT